MRKILIRCLTNVLGFYLAWMLFPAITSSSLENFLWAGLALGLLNLFIRPLLLLISLPLTILTLGLFTLIINTILVIMAVHLISGLYIPSFTLSFATAIIISITNIITDRLLKL